MFHNLDLVMTVFKRALFIKGELFALATHFLSGACLLNNLTMISSKNVVISIGIVPIIQSSQEFIAKEMIIEMFIVPVQNRNRNMFLKKTHHLNG